MFEATELLRAVIKDQTAPARTAAHDLELFCWVFVGTAYLRAVQNAPDSQTRSALQRERRRIFAAMSCQELLNNRAVALPADLCEAFDSIQGLKTYLDGAGEKRLAECLDTCWYLLKGFPACARETAADAPQPCDDLGALPTDVHGDQGHA